MSILAWAAVCSLVAWGVLIFLRGGFWRANQRLPDNTSDLPLWPAVAAVIPARDEAAHVGDAVASLLAQDYAGPFGVVVVDDSSTDGTSEVARAAAGGDARLRVLAGRPLEGGWTGKLWAVSQGIAAAETAWPEAEFLLLCDADIGHDPANLRRLVAKAASGNLDLVSLMVRLRCDSVWERLLVPAFVFFFQKLFPFAWVNDPARRTAAAAGGCMLVRREALARIGGIAAIRGRLIDDCALAAEMKAGGPIWLGLTTSTVSLRAYDGLAPLWRMVARSAFEQLGNSVLMLLGAVIGMLFLYALPPIALLWGLIAGDPTAALAGALGWAAMGIAYRPIVRLYGLGAAWTGMLPVAALFYVVFTVDSARRAWMGARGAWKGRTYSAPASGDG